MLTVLVDDDHLLEAVRAGVRGYVLKGGPPVEVAAGCAGRSPGNRRSRRASRCGSSTQFAGRDSRRVFVPDRRIGASSPRGRRRCSRCSGRGWPPASSPSGCACSPVTVRTHVSTALKKLGAKDRKEAIQLFER